MMIRKFQKNYFFYGTSKFKFAFNFEKLFKNTKKIQNLSIFNNNIFSKRLFTSSQGNKDNNHKKEEINNKEKTKDLKEEENEKYKIDKNSNKNEMALNEKYRELRELYEEQEQNLDQIKNKFNEIKNLYLKGIEEIDCIKIKNNREIKNLKEHEITKFAKDLLNVHDDFKKALNVIAEKDFKNLSNKEKDEIFAIFVKVRVIYLKIIFCK